MKCVSHDESSRNSAGQSSWVWKGNRLNLWRWSPALLSTLLGLLLGSSSPAQAQTITTVVGPSTPPLSLPLNQPHGIAVDASGSLYIADTNNCVVWKVSSDFQTATVFAGQLGNCGTASVAPSGTTSPTSVQLDLPLDVAACNGAVFILDQTLGSGLHKVDASGNFSNLIPPFHYSPSHVVRGPGNPPAVQPQAIACDASGDLFIQSFYTTLDGAIYSLDALSSTGVSSNLGEIFQGIGTYVGVAADPQGNVYTLNISALGNGDTVKFTTTNSSGTINVVGGSGVYQPFTQPYPAFPSRIATDGYGDFYVNATSSGSSTSPAVWVDQISPTGLGTYSLNQIAGTGIASFNGDGPALASTLDLNNPLGIAANCTNVFIADTGNNRIRSLPPNPGSCAAGVVLTLSASAVPVSTPVTLTANATVNSVTARGGSVSFFDNGVLLGVVQIITSNAQGGVPGSAVLTARFGSGTHTLTAVFHANQPNVTATSAPETLTVGTPGEGQIATQTMLSAQPDAGTPTNFDFSGAVFGFGFQAPLGTLSLSASGSAVGAPATLVPASFPPNGMPYAFLTQTHLQNATVPAAAADLNGDGIPDLIVFDGSGNSTATFGILLGNGDGTFQGETTYCMYDGTTPLQPGPCAKPLAYQPAGAVIADVNGDGIPDVVVFASIYSGPGTGSSTEPGAVLVYLGTGGGKFNPVPIVSTGFNAGQDSLTSGDMNNDGFLDLVVTSLTQQTVTVLLGHGDGTFSVSQSIPVPAASHSVVADFNHDGNPDIATTNYLIAGQTPLNSISILLGKGDGTFAAPAVLNNLNLNVAYTLLAADLNLDGWPDLAVVNTNGISILLNNQTWSGGAIGFASPTSYPVGFGPETIAAGDLNGDGFLDLFVGNSDNSLSLLLSSGPGTFLPAQSIASVGGSFGMVAADFNGDSVPDLAVLSYSNPFFQTNILLGGTESLASSALLQNLTVPGAGPTQVLGTYTPSASTWGTSSGSATVRGINTLATETLSAVAPTYTVYAGDSGSFQVFFKPAANVPSAVPPPTGAIALTATLAGQPTVSTPTPSPYTVGFCYVPVYSGGCPVTIAFPVAGTWTITASYAGDANWAPATAPPVNFTVVQVSTSLSFQNANPSTVAAGVVFNAELLLNLLEFQNPTGNVNFTVTNGTTSVIVPSQSAAFLTMNSMYGIPTAIPIIFPSAGTWTITANYPGDTLYMGSSASLTVNVTGAACPSGATLSISAPSTNVLSGQQLQFTANVTGITNPVVSWGISPATGGTISTTGLYTASAIPGLYQIVATLSSCTGLSSMTTVNVISAPPPPTPAAVPTFSPSPGSYSSPQSVTLASTVGATIYYTMDGTQPTTSSTIYSGPISVSANQTITAFAGGTGYVASATAAGRYSFFALGAELIPGTLSSFIAATPVGSVPSDVVFDAGGNFYVLDSGLGTITKFAAGTNTNGTIIVPTGTLSNPQFFTVGVDGQTLFVSDYGNNRIVTVSQTTSPATINTLTLTGVPSASITCTASPGATICQPTGIFADSNGNLYVSDSGYQRLLKLTSTGTYVSTPLDSTHLAGGLGTLFGVAADNAGNVYVALTASSVALGPGVVAIKSSGSIGFLPQNLQHGHGVAVDPSGDVYVTDSLTMQVYEYDAVTRTQYILAGVNQNVIGTISSDSGDGGPSTVGSIANPRGITLDSNYNVYVADANPQTSSGGSIREVNVSQGISNFASINYGQSASQSVWFVNPTGKPLTINSLNFAGTYAADFTDSVATPLLLAPGQIVAEQVAFTPSIFGAESATLTPAEVFSGTPASLTQLFTLNGTGLSIPWPPTITSISCCDPYAGVPIPAGFPGEKSETITVFGTHFNDPTGNGAVPTFDFGPSISVSHVAVTSSTTATMSLDILPSAAIGPVSVTVTTGSPSTFQGGTATLPGGFAIAPYLPTISSISATNLFLALAVPDGYPGETETVTVSGTNFVDPTGNNALPVFNFGPGVTAKTVSVALGPSGTPVQTATVNLVISPTAPTGPVSVSVTTGSVTTFQGGTVTLTGGFGIAPYVPAITSIAATNLFLALASPDGYPGETETVTVTGTNFVDPTGNNALPVFNFGPGVTAKTVSVTPGAPSTSSQTATVNLIISPTAPIGPVSVSVTTGSASTFQGGTATMNGGFGIAAYLPTIISIAGNNVLTGLAVPGGYQGQSETVTVSGTNFVDPTGNNALPAFNFGSGVTATTVSVTPGAQTTSLQTATVNLVISSTAPPASANVIVTTGSSTTFQGGSYALTGAFQIVASNTPAAPNGQTPPITPIDTTTGKSPVTLTFFNVPQPGQTSLTTSSTGPAAPSAFQLGTPPVYYLLSATMSFTSVEICINYAGISFTALPPQLFHYTNGSWVLLPLVPTTAPTTVCGMSQSLSPFALFQSGSTPTTTAVTAASVSYGTPASVTVSVSASSGTVTGSVSLSVDGGGASTMALSSGTATFNPGVLSAGNHSLTSSFAPQGSFQGSSATGLLTVAQTPLLITASNVSRPYEQPNPSSFAVTYSGFVNGDTSSSLSGALSCTTSATAASPVGTYPITCTGLTSSNYAITFVPGTLTVIREVLSITAKFKSIALASNGTYIVTIAVTNNGDVMANKVASGIMIGNLVVPGGSLGDKPDISTTPTLNLAPGATASITLVFPASAGKPLTSRELLAYGFATATNPNGTPVPPALWVLQPTPTQVTLP